MVIARRDLTLAAIASTFFVASRVEASEMPKRTALSFELTFLKAKAPGPARLSEFIKLNWFEMDRIAVEQGIMIDYRLLKSADTNGPWDMVVIVGYPDERGYAAIAEQFGTIRAAHTIRLVGGLGFTELGTIVESKRLLPA